MDKVEIEFDIKETSELGDLISSLSAPKNDGAAVGFNIERIDTKFVVTIYPSAY